MITPCLNNLHNRLESREIKLSDEKSSVTVFTNWSEEAKFYPHFTIKNLPIPVETKVKVLGVPFDGMLNFDVRSIKEKLQRRNNISKRLVATGAAQKGNAQRLTSIGPSVLNYTAPIGLPHSAIQTVTTCKPKKHCTL